MANALISFSLDITAMLAKIDETDTKLYKDLVAYGNQVAKRLETYAKTHKKWQNRTGQAQNRLHGWSEMSTDAIDIYLGHGVEYGIYLEMAHEKRFAIIYPTILQLQGEVMQGLQGLLG